MDDKANLTSTMDSDGNASGQTQNGLMAATFCFLTAMVLLSNILVVMAIARSRLLYGGGPVYNMLLINLAIADLLTGTSVAITPGFIAEEAIPIATGLSGELVCRVISSHYVIFTCGKVSIATITCLAVERWYAMARPLAHRSVYTRRRAAFYLILIWCICGVLNLRAVFDQELDLVSNVKVTCEWVKLTKYKTAAKVYAIFLSVVTFIIPATVSWLTAGHLGFLIRRSKHNVLMQGRRSLAAKQLLRMSITSAAVLSVCWLPNQIFFILAKFDVTEFDSLTHHVTILLCLFSACVNPFVHCASNRKYRKTLLGLLYCNRKLVARPIAQPNKAFVLGTISSGYVSRKERTGTELQIWEDSCKLEQDYAAPPIWEAPLSATNLGFQLEVGAGDEKCNSDFRGDFDFVMNIGAKVFPGSGYGTNPHSLGVASDSMVGDENDNMYQNCHSIELTLKFPTDGANDQHTARIAHRSHSNGQAALRHTSQSEGQIVLQRRSHNEAQNALHHTRHSERQPAVHHTRNSQGEGQNILQRKSHSEGQTALHRTSQSEGQNVLQRTSHNEQVKTALHDKSHREGQTALHRTSHSEVQNARHRTCYSKDQDALHRKNNEVQTALHHAKHSDVQNELNHTSFSEGQNTNCASHSHGGGQNAEHRGCHSDVQNGCGIEVIPPLDQATGYQRGVRPPLDHLTRCDDHMENFIGSADDDAFVSLSCNTPNTEYGEVDAYSSPVASPLVLDTQF